jgi:AraC-like DNA-binding protein
VDRALQYLESHYREEISLLALSRQTHQSINSLLTDFKAATGESPIQYLLHLRLRKAADLLVARPELNISEAAFAAGFNDSNYFSRQFRRRFRIAPRSFRRAALTSTGDLGDVPESLRRRCRRSALRPQPEPARSSPFRKKEKS